MDRGRLIVDEPASGAWNMAVDEMLLHSAARTGICSLRFYRWNEPTVSLGYFQKHADRQLHQSSRNCALVRRTTGGGAIVHDQELTYSFCAPMTGRGTGVAKNLYKVFHYTLIEVLAGWKIRASLCENALKKPAKDEPFLCFQRRSEGDVLLNGSKIAGSAQRRHQGAVLQHGSVLLRTSACAAELSGIEELSGITLILDEFIERWTDQICTNLGIETTITSLEAEHLAAARLLACDKFGCDQWTNRR